MQDKVVYLTPEGKQRFPTFETYREQIDGKYWFPTYTYADDDLGERPLTVRADRVRQRCRQQAQDQQGKDKAQCFHGRYFTPLPP